MSCAPDFVIIGAMKSATTTLHEQLARQPGLWMSRPKEPNYFSDDEHYEKGFDWYGSLFAGASEGDLRGESSTHYTKLPTYPHTVERMRRALPRVKLIYVMRHPIDRLISHYVHEVTVGQISAGILDAIDTHSELIDYGRYAMQLTPYLEAFGPDRILPVFFTRLVRHPQDELERIGRFLGIEGHLRWDHALKPQNVGSERLRRSVLRDLLVQSPVLSTIRRRVIPQPWSESIKTLWRARTERPSPSPELVERLRGVFDEDLDQLGHWLGTALNCDTFEAVTEAQSLEWDRSTRRV